MPSSPRRPNGPGAPSPPKSPHSNPSASAATFSPRRPTIQRTGGDHPSHRDAVYSPVGSRLAASLALATQDTLMSAMANPASANGTTTTKVGGNPHVQAIQSRVAELVRRYDESMASDRAALDEDDEDENRVDVPTRWRVGDMLLATHSSLAKTSTRTERSMIAEFGDDPEVSAAIGSGEQSFTVVFDEASRKAEQMKLVLAKTLHVVQQLQHTEELGDAAARMAGASTQQQMRDLKITVEALHKEKAMILSQLHEHVKSHKEMLATMEDQNQELKKTQIAISMKTDELKSARDEFAFRLSDLQKMNETSQQNATMWRDKYQSTLKLLGDAEAKVSEIEKKSHGQGEEVMKHEFVLRTKNAELEKLKDRLKESEALRLKAEAAQKEAVAAAAASATEAAAANKRLEATSKSKTPVATNESAAAKPSSKAMQDLEAKIRQQEATIRDLQQRLSDLNATRSKFEEDNNELARIVREMQARAQEVINSRPPPSSPASSGQSQPMPSIRRATSFSLSLKREPVARRKRRATDDNDATLGKKKNHPPDDLSTSSSEENEVDPETERDELELNQTVQQVVTLVFPQRVSPLEEHSDEVIDNSIAMYEQDPITNRPISSSSSIALSATPFDTVAKDPTIRVNVGSISSSSELDQLRLAHADEIAQLKKQYVATLIEYKKLVIEQYERRQNEIQQHHRMEIENLIMLVQAKFKRELERRGECMMQAKESLKLLYRAMQSGVPGGTLSGRLKGFAEEDGLSDDDDNTGDDEPVEEPVPLKSILRAAVFAMSSSKQRNEKANAAISDIYDNIRGTKRSPKKPVVKVAVKKSGAIRGAESVDSTATTTAPAQDTDWGAFLKSMRANREEAARHDANAKAVVVHVACQVDENDFVIYSLKGLRGSHVSPENLEHYVLPSSSVFSLSNGPQTELVASSDVAATRRLGLEEEHGVEVVKLTKGALLGEAVVAEVRAVLPFLPPGSYYLSSALRHHLLLEMIRFYADLGRHHQQQQQQQQQHSRERAPVVEVVVGSPRDTPFMRRKAIESVDRKHRRRGETLSNGAMAMLQQLPPSASISTSSVTLPSSWTPARGFVSHSPTMSLSHHRGDDF